MTQVVAALIWQGDRFMICQRPSHKTRALQWEFVGGKVEEGETREEALVRECQEELDVTVSVGKPIMTVTHTYPDITVCLTFFEAAILAGTPKKREHADIRFITPEEIPQYRFCPADEAFLKKLMEEKDLKEVRVGGSTLFRGRIVSLQVDDVRLPDGSYGKREVVCHPGGVCVAPLTEDDQLIFVKQWRYPYGEVTLELPAGKLERGEDPDKAARRELSEETGATGTLRKMGEMYPTPGYVDEIIRLYVATGLTVGELHTDADEFIKTETIPLEKAVEMVLSGELKDAKTCLLILAINERKRRGLPL